MKIFRRRPTANRPPAPRTRHETRARPPDEVPFPPGCCTEWVASKKSPRSGRCLRARIGSAAHVGDQRVCSQKEAPRSVHQHIAVCRLPVIFATTFAMSPRRQELPLLDIDDPPPSRLPPAGGRSWRHMKAGICRMSTACATSAHWLASWMSVSTGRPKRGTESPLKIGSDCLSPMPRAGRGAGAVGPCRRRSCRPAQFRGGPRSLSARRPLSSAWARLSSWQGPGDDRDRQIIAEFDRACGKPRAQRRYWHSQAKSSFPPRGGPCRAALA